MCSHHYVYYIFRSYVRLFSNDVVFVSDSESEEEAGIVIERNTKTRLKKIVAIIKLEYACVYI